MEDEGQAGHIGSLRLALVERRNELRLAEDDLDYQRVAGYFQLLDTVDGDAKKLGANETDRKLAVEQHLLSSDEYGRVKGRVFKAQYGVDLAQARLEALKDQRREEEFGILRRMADNGTGVGITVGIGSMHHEG